jgi:hypothetical protein
MKDSQKKQDQDKSQAAHSGGKRQNQHPPGMTRTGAEGDPTGAPMGDSQAQDKGSKQPPASKRQQGDRH